MGAGAQNRGSWSQQEAIYHVNEQELAATKHAILKFTKIRKPKRLHLLIENTSALSYLVKMGGTHNPIMLNLAKEIWEYLMQKEITLTAEYIPSELNKTPDWWSRNWKDSSEWKLNPIQFQRICDIFGIPDIDLFASRISHQVQDTSDGDQTQGA